MYFPVPGKPTGFLIFWNQICEKSGYFTFEIERTDTGWDRDKEHHERSRKVMEQLFQKDLFKEISVQGVCIAL